MWIASECKGAGVLRDRPRFAATPPASQTGTRTTVREQTHTAMDLALVAQGFPGGPTRV